MRTSAHISILCYEMSKLNVSVVCRNVYVSFFISATGPEHNACQCLSPTLKLKLKLNSPPPPSLLFCTAGIFKQEFPVSKQCPAGARFRAHFCSALNKRMWMVSQRKNTYKLLYNITQPDCKNVVPLSHNVNSLGSFHSIYISYSR